MATREGVPAARIANRAFINEVNARTVCAHCGAQPIEWHNPDHVEPGRGTYRIGNMVTQPATIAAIQAEIERCTPLCRRCHMKEDGRLRIFGLRGLKGETNGRAKLTEENVREARMLRATGMTLTALAERFGMTHRGIRLAVTGETWGHIS